MTNPTFTPGNPPGPTPPPGAINITLQQLVDILTRLTEQHHATRQLQPFYQYLLTLSMRGIGIGNNGNVDQTGEMGIMNAIRQTLERDYPAGPWHIFDVGANAGQYMAALLHVFAPAGTRARFYSFEPSRRAFEQLQKTVAGRENVQTFNFGMGEKEESLPLYSNEAGAEIGSIYQRQLDHQGIVMKPVEQVTIRTVDQFAREQNIDRIHFLKIDTEGHELKCMHGAREMIESGRVDFIQFEMGCNVDARTYFRDFWNLLTRGNGAKYQIGRILRDGLFEIDKYSQNLELFSTQNFLATRIK